MIPLTELTKKYRVFFALLCGVFICIAGIGFFYIRDYYAQKYLDEENQKYQDEQKWRATLPEPQTEPNIMVVSEKETTAEKTDLTELENGNSNNSSETITVNGGSRFDDPSGLYSIVIPQDFILEYQRKYSSGVLYPRALKEVVGKKEIPLMSISVYKNPEGLSIWEYFDGSPGSSLFNDCFEGHEIKDVNGRRIHYIELNCGIAGGIKLAMYILDDAFIEIVDSAWAFQGNGSPETNEFEETVRSVTIHEQSTSP